MNQQLKKIRGEIIGLLAMISRAKNPSIEGICGKVIDETRHSIKLETENHTKINQRLFGITIPYTSESKILRFIRPHFLKIKNETKINQTKTILKNQIERIWFPSINAYIDGKSLGKRHKKE